jgi:predicted nuclease of predicted toxin-antitoxin system
MYADKNDLIVLTKDADFRNSFLIGGTPNKLVKINLGNISTNALIEVISENIEAMKLLELK